MFTGNAWTVVLCSNRLQCHRCLHLPRCGRCVQMLGLCYCDRRASSCRHAHLERHLPTGCPLNIPTRHPQDAQTCSWTRPNALSDACPSPHLMSTIAFAMRGSDTVAQSSTRSRQGWKVMDPSSTPPALPSLSVSSLAYTAHNTSEQTFFRQDAAQPSRTFQHILNTRASLPCRPWPVTKFVPTASCHDTKGVCPHPCAHVQ